MHNVIFKKGLRFFLDLHRVIKLIFAYRGM